MVSKRFALLVIIRIGLLMLTLTALAFIFAKTELFFNQIILGSIIIIQVSELIRFITYTNRELAKLLLAIRYSDFSISFKGKKHGKSFQELQDAFVEIIDAFKKVSVEKEAQFKFLKVIEDFSICWSCILNIQHYYSTLYNQVIIWKYKKLDVPPHLFLTL